MNEQQNIHVEDTKTREETISASESPNSSSSSYKELLSKTNKDTPHGIYFHILLLRSLIQEIIIK